MKRILLICAFVPSNTSGGLNYSRLFINDLAKTYKVDLVLFKYSYLTSYNIENENVTVVKVFKNSFLIKLINCIFSPFLHPFFTSRFNVVNLLKIKRIINKKKYDAIYLDYSQIFLYGKFIKNIPKIFMSHDVITQRYLRSGSKLSAKLCLISEKFVLNCENSKVFVFSKKDKNLMSKYFKIDSLVTSFYVEKAVFDTPLDKIDDYYVFYGTWKRKDNYEGLLWFFKNIYPFVESRVKIKILGKGLDPFLKFIDYQNVNYLGFVKNPYLIISRSKGLIAPLFSGAGVKVKVIESLACGTIVIGTKIAFEGVDELFSEYLIDIENYNFEDCASFLNSYSPNLDEKRKLKELFLSNYHQNKEVLTYINLLLNDIKN
jgi:glycosyltransferase involved in cell wall biosynthesis